MYNLDSVTCYDSNLGSFKQPQRKNVLIIVTALFSFIERDNKYFNSELCVLW